MSNQAKLKEIVRELIKKEVEEASTSSATPGYQTPMAFSGVRKKDKDKKRVRITKKTSSKRKGRKNKRRKKTNFWTKKTDYWKWKAN